MEKRKCIVGLGNPGEEYRLTRHNLGFLVLDQLAEKFNLKFKKDRLSNGFSAEGKMDGCSFILFKPMTFMNHSGVGAAQLVKSRETAIEDLLVVSDDCHLEFGQIRIRNKGSDGGHNGLTSIIEHLKTQHFARLRMGVGKPGTGKDLTEYVLGRFTTTEQKALNSFIKEAADCSCTWAVHGVEAAMNQFNKGKSDE